MSGRAQDSTDGERSRRRFTRPIPKEGDDGVFTEYWFPICLSRELAVGSHVGRPFLDGRVVAVRGEDEEARVFSAYCPHLGADLAVGEVGGDGLRCAFHRWEFDGEGWCTKTGLGEPPPRDACLYRFHAVEKFGLVWAFNGEEPWWDLPDFPIPEDELDFAVHYDVPPVPVDPWVICANTPDWQHLKAVHRLAFDHEALFEKIEWTDHSMEYDLDGTMEGGAGPALSARVGIFGTSLFRLFGEAGGVPTASMTAFGMPQPGVTQVYHVLGTRKGDGSPESKAQVAMVHDVLFRLAKSIVSDDRPILHSLHYQPGLMTSADQALVKYLNLVRDFPRSHPSASFIR
jgi:nitrite reductase/ring-hydroxylating ferredoxin subunit